MTAYLWRFSAAGTRSRPTFALYQDLGDSLKYAGLHHFCVHVNNVDATLAVLRERGVPIVAEPFVLPAISRKLAFFADPFGNLIELSEIVD